MTILKLCCDEAPQSGIHMTAAHCTEQMRLIHSDPTAACQGPSEHHKFERHVDLERGKWTYVILAEEWSVITGYAVKTEFYLDATQSVTEAFRIARKHVQWRRVYTDKLGNPSGSHPRKGLAYGFIIDGPEVSCTIIPTPRYV